MYAADGLDWRVVVYRVGVTTVLGGVGDWRLMTKFLVWCMCLLDEAGTLE